MRNPFRVFWGIVAMGLIIAYLSSGANLTVRPEAMTWEEFSGNPVAMAHFAERHELTWHGTPAQTEALKKVFDQNVTNNREFTRTPAILEETDSRNPFIARLQHTMRALYDVWQPKPRVRHGTGFRLSPIWQLRWNVGMTIGVLFGLILICTTGITVFERKAGV